MLVVIVTTAPNAVTLLIVFPPLPLIAISVKVLPLISIASLNTIVTLKASTRTTGSVSIRTGADGSSVVIVISPDSNVLPAGSVTFTLTVNSSFEFVFFG